MNGTAIAELLTQHYIESYGGGSGINLGQYRTRWKCACGFEFITDGHKGEHRRDLLNEHIADVLTRSMARPEWAETLRNDGTYEYTTTGDCHGTVEYHLRRSPARSCGAWERVDAIPYDARFPDECGHDPAPRRDGCRTARQQEEA